MYRLSSNAVSASIRKILVPWSFRCLLCRLLEFHAFLVEVLEALELLLTRIVEGPFSLWLLEISTKTKAQTQHKAANKSVWLQCLHKTAVSYQTSVHTSQCNKNRG